LLLFLRQFAGPHTCRCKRCTFSQLPLDQALLDRLPSGKGQLHFRSPVREALLALEKEGTLIMSLYKGATVKPLSAAEVLDIAELRLALISLALITVSG
jgi:hypothetical protein